MKGRVFNVQRFCLQDGPGIRTTVFMKGCPLRCAWCHNPESQSRQAEILYDASKCLACGACAAACPRGLHIVEDERHEYLRTGCDGCGACASACPAEALELCGREADSGDVLDTVTRDVDFYAASGGGMTLSGGEPMAQPEFALALARGAKDMGIHVCLETCGYCSREDFQKIMPHVDLFLFDFKLADGEAHRRYTGADNALILENLNYLNDAGAGIILRCPVIPGVNLTDAHFDAIAEAAKRHPRILGIDLEPYHPLGIEKARRLGRAAAYGETAFLPGDSLRDRARRLEAGCGVPVNVI